MDANTLTQFYMDILKEEGYVPKINERGYIVFKVEGNSYSIVKIDERNTRVFCMYVALKDECNSSKELIKLLQIASYTNAMTRFVKTFIRKNENEVAAIFAIESLVNKPEDFKLNITTWINALVNARLTFSSIFDKMNGEDKNIIRNFHSSVKSLAENEEQIVLRETGQRLTYTLTNSIGEIVGVIYKKTGINLGEIPESEWEVNDGLSQDVKNLMNKHGANYSMTTWIEDDCLHLAINHKVNNHHQRWWLVGRPLKGAVS